MFCFIAERDCPENTEYVSYSRDIYLHDNEITRTDECPVDADNQILPILTLLYGLKCDMSEILWDGITNLEVFKDDLTICVQNSGAIDDLDLFNFGEPEHNMMRDVQHFNCDDKDSLSPVEVLAPTL